MRSPLGRSVLALTVMLLGREVAALEVPDRPQGPVSDYAGALSSSDRARVSAALEADAKGTTQRIAVAIFPSLDGEVLEDYSIRLAERWKIGSRKNSDGVLLLLFMKEHKIRIEVGYGLEAQLPDAAAAHVIRDAIAPALRAGRLADGILAGVDAIHAAIAPPPPEPAQVEAPEPRLADLPWTRPAARPDDRADPRVYDFAGELDPRAFVALEALARGVADEGGERYLIAIFAKQSAGADAVVTELERRWNLAGGRVVFFCSYLDSVMSTRVSPSLQARLDDARIGEIVQQHIRPFYEKGDVGGGLTAGLYAAYATLNGHAPRIVVPPPPPEPAAEAVDPPPPPPAHRPFYLPRTFFEDAVVSRLEQTPMPLRVPLTAVLAVLGLLLRLPFILSFVFVVSLVAFVVRPWSIRAQARTGGLPFFVRGLGAIALGWGPFVATMLWTEDVPWVIFAVISTAFWLFMVLPPETRGRGGSSGGVSWDSSSSSSDLGSSSSSSDSWSSSDGGGDFGGGGASGDW